MSIKCMNYVWEHSKTTGADRLMLLALADSCNDDGEWSPGVSRLADKCQVSERAAQYTLRRLEEMGEIEILHQQGFKTKTGHTNKYLMKRYQQRVGQAEGVQPIAPFDNEGVKPVAPRKAKGVKPVAPLGVQPIAPESSVLPTSNTLPIRSDQGEGSKIAAAPPAPPPATPVSERMGNEEYEHPLTKSLLPSPPIAAPPSPKRITSPHFDPRRLRDGYIPAGEGVNPVEIYFERYSANECKLNAPSQDDLIRAVTDLGRWRQVVIAWQQSGYKPANIKGMLDWYHDPSKIPGARSDNGKEKSSGHHATTPAPEPGRYAKLKAGKVT